MKITKALLLSTGLSAPVRAAIPHIRSNTICVTGALLFYNLLAALSGQLGKGELVRVLLSPPRKPPNPAAKP